MLNCVLGGKPGNSINVHDSGMSVILGRNRHELKYRLSFKIGIVVMMKAREACT